MKKFTKNRLEKIYLDFNKRELVNPDPLYFLYDYQKREDIETAGLIASSLAYGNIKTIMKSVKIILDLLGPNPADFLDNSNDLLLLNKTKGFIHRFAKSENITALLKSIRLIRKEYGTLEALFLNSYKKDHENILKAAQKFTSKIHEFSAPFSPGHLIPRPEKKSSCKRLNLYFRWMVRNDDVDPGWWDIDKSKLIIPLDTHMHKIGLEYGFTKRKGTTILTAMDVTNGFKKFSPKDPVKYDFSLTRQGIRGDVSFD